MTDAFFSLKRKIWGVARKETSEKTLLPREQYLERQ